MPTDPHETVERCRIAAERCGFGNSASTIDGVKADGDRFVAIRRTLAQFSKTLTSGLVLYVRVSQDLTEGAQPQLEVLVGSGEQALPEGDLTEDTKVEVEKEIDSFLKVIKETTPVAA